MNWSKYNYLFKSSKFGHLLYNSLSNSFAELDEEGYNYLKTLEGKENIQIKDTAMLQSLIKMKVLVDNDLDEYYNIKYITQWNRFARDYLELTINPTLHCNFACPYCFESKKPPVYMDDNVENALIDFIKNMKGIKHIHVNWFGGEPLMAFDKVVSITQKIKQTGIEYSAKMITNGYLMCEHVVDQLDNLNINDIQVTVDGLADIHDKRRILVSGGGTFERIIKNIDYLKSKKPEFPVIIRANIDATNAQQYIDVFMFFLKRYKNHITVMPGFVTDDTSGCTSDCVFDREKRVDFLITQYQKYGLNALGFYPDYRYECPVRNPYHIVIGPQGEIYKCWVDVGNMEKVVGHLINKHQTNQKLLTRYYVAGDALDDYECRECLHFPTCGGGCPHNRIENEFNEKKTDTCDFVKGHLSEFLELHYDFKQKISNKNEKDK